MQMSPVQARVGAGGGTANAIVAEMRGSAQSSRSPSASGRRLLRCKQVAPRRNEPLASGVLATFVGVDRSWRVVFRGPVSDEVLAQLPEDKMVHVSGHEGAGRRSSTIWVRATDAGAAESAVRAVITTPGTIEPATALAYWMSIGVPEADADALDRVIGERRSDSIDSLITKEPSDGFAEVMLEVVAETDQGAVRRGLDEYRDLRVAASLEPTDPPYFTLHPPWPGRQPQHHHLVLLELARLLQEHREWDLAIVVAQTAFEVRAAQVVYERLEARDIGGLRAHITSHIRTYSLVDDRTQKLWQELTEDAIKQAGCWAQYRDHVGRRNAVVHQGVDVNEAEAAASLGAVEAMIAHVEQLGT
jgi:hypothetical protein